MENEELPRGYIEEREKIDKNTSRINYSVLASNIMLLLAMIYPIGRGLKSEGKKLWNLQKKPIYQECVDNQVSLNYLRDELNKFSPQQIPDSISEKTKKELESITKSYEDSFTINRLETALKTKQTDSARIANSDEFKDYISKEMEIRKGNSVLWLFPFLPISLGYLGICISGVRRRRKLKALRERYKIED